MLSLILTTTLACLLGVAGAGGGLSSVKPDCVDKCWIYTQYVSPLCWGDTKCLCDDSEFQNAVYQCLYSQCHTAQFGIALHHALSLCHVNQEGNLVSSGPAAAAQTSASAPALIRQEGLRKRAPGAYMYGSRSASNSNSAYRSASVTRSAGPSASVTRSARPTRSVSNSAYMTKSVGRASPTRSVSASAYMTKTMARAMPTVQMLSDGQIWQTTLVPIEEMTDHQPYATSVAMYGRDAHRGYRRDRDDSRKAWERAHPH